MLFWIYMMIVDLLFPVVIILFGAYFKKKAPSEINYVFGYRTSMSMKTRETWEFAHSYCGKLWFRGGLVLLSVTVVLMLPVMGQDKDTVGFVGALILILPLSFVVISIILTEKALKKNFNKYGRRIIK